MSELDRLLRFVTVAEELSFSRAAEKLNVDQPWLSRQIRQLEAQIGFQLFIRNTRQVALTPEGKAVLDSAKRFSTAADDIRRTLSEVGRRQSESVFLGVSTSSFWVPARKVLVDRFHAMYPRGRVETLSADTTTLISLIRNRKIDCALALHTRQMDELDYISLHRQLPGILIPEEHPLSKSQSVPLAALAGEPLAVTRRALDAEAGEVIYAPFLAAGMKPVVVPEGRAGMIYHATAQRLFLVSIGWPHSDEEIGKDFVYRDIADAMVPVEYGMARLPEESSRAVERFWQVGTKVSGDCCKVEQG